MKNLDQSAVQVVMDAWNNMARRSKLPPIRLMNTTRLASLRARINQVGLDGMLEAITKVGESAFCHGDNNRGWQASFDFILQQKSLTGLLEHGYAWRNRPTLRNGAMAALLEMQEAAPLLEYQGDD